MVRYATNTNYGATGSLSSPPPYSGLTTPDLHWPSLNNSVDSPGTSVRKISEWLNIRTFAMFLTFAITVGLYMTRVPITYCNDPADPHVRERIREEWSKELFEHEKLVAEREVVKARWVWEDEWHAAQLHEWEEERIEHERQLKERARCEEDERVGLGLFWSRVEAHQCKTYGTREYTAVLKNLPMNWERRIEACKATPLEVHGISYVPKSCENSASGVVTGTWEINQHEPDCTTFWIWYKDKERSGKRRIEHYLENLPRGSDWREFCATTPVRFDGLEFSGAQECFPKNTGAFGYWEIDDAGCS